MDRTCIGENSFSLQLRHSLNAMHANCIPIDIALACVAVVAAAAVAVVVVVVVVVAAAVLFQYVTVVRESLFPPLPFLLFLLLFLLL